MQTSPIQVGPISLQGFEIPSAVSFGGRHRLAVHNLSNGKRSVETLGPDDGEIAFHGTFSGIDAAIRVRLFDSLRLSGEIVWLTWESFRRQVIVSSFAVDYNSPWWIPYRVSCTVVHQDIPNSQQYSSLSSLVSAYLDSALAASTGSDIQLTALQASLSVPNVFTIGTAAQTQAVINANAALNRIDASIDQKSTALSTTAAIPGALQWGQAFIATVGQAGSLAAAVNTRSYVGRIGASLSGGELA